MDRGPGILASLTERYSRVGWAIADQLLVSGASFVTTLLVARFLGKEEFGRFVIAWLATLIVQNIQIALITTPVTTFAMREPPDRQPAYFGAVGVHQGIFAVVTTALVYGLAVASARVVPGWRLDAVAGPLAVVVLIGQLTEILRRYFYLNERADISFLLDVARYGPQIALLAVLFLALPGQAGLGAVLGVMALSALLGGAVGLANLRRVEFDWVVVKAVALRHWKFSRWLLGSTLITTAREILVSVSVGSLLGLTEVGVLRAVQQLVLIINVPLFVMHNTVPIHASRAYGELGFAGLVAYMKGFAARYFCFLCGILLLIGAFGEPLLTLVYGQAYAGNGGLVTAFALITIVFLVRDFIALMVKTAESTDFDFYASVAGALVTAVLLFPLVGWLGLAGALLTEACMQAGMLAIFARGLARHWSAASGATKHAPATPARAASPFSAGVAAEDARRAPSDP